MRSKKQLIPTIDYVEKAISISEIKPHPTAEDLAPLLGFPSLCDFSTDDMSGNVAGIIDEVVTPWFDKVVYKRDLTNIRGLLICSVETSDSNGRGVGKTLLASSAYYGLGYFSALGTNPVKLCWERAGYWFNGGSELVATIKDSPLKSNYIQPGQDRQPNRILVLDDLTRATFGGASMVSKEAQQGLFQQTVKDVMDRVHLHEMAYVITSNMTLNKFAQFVGMSAYDRIIQHALPIVISGEDSQRIQDDAVSMRLVESAGKFL